MFGKGGPGYVLDRRARQREPTGRHAMEEVEQTRIPGTEHANID